MKLRGNRIMIDLDKARADRRRFAGAFVERRLECRVEAVENE